MSARAPSEASMTEDALEAYLDGELPAEQRPVVEAYLAAHPEDAARLEAYAAQRRCMHKLYDQHLNEPSPIAVASLEARLAARLREASWRRWLWPGAAALAASVFVASAVWLVAPEPIEHPHLAASGQPPETTAIVGSQVQEPTMVAAGGSPAPASTQIPDAEQAPDLAHLGFEVVETRMLSGDAPIVQLTYQDSGGARLWLYLGPTTEPDTTELTLIQGDAVSLLSWRYGGQSNSIVGEVDGQTLMDAARVVGGDTLIRLRTSGAQ